MTTPVLSALTAIAILISALQTRAQVCSRNEGRDTVTCSNLKGDIGAFVAFLKNIDENDFLRVQTL